MMNFYNQWNLMPMIPTNNIEPPTIFSILQSIVNFGKEEKTKVPDLAKEGRERIFNFDYPLTSKVDKEKFECMILNHFLMRRINFDTVLIFQVQLENKLNEIMPFYNQLFDSIDGWNLFGDEVHDLQSNTTSETNYTNSMTNTDDLRNSDMPQSRIENVKDGNYLTNYSFNTSNNDSNSNTNGSNQNILHETRNRTPSEKIEVYKAFQNDIKNVYTLLFKELEPLFYQIIP